MSWGSRESSCQVSLDQPGNLSCSPGFHIRRLRCAEDTVLQALKMTQKPRGQERDVPREMDVYIARGVLKLDIGHAGGCCVCCRETDRDEDEGRRKRWPRNKVGLL